MAASVAKPCPSSLVNSLDLQMAKASIDVKVAVALADSAPVVDVVSLFFETLAECGIAEKEAAYAMAMDPAQLSRVKHGQARLPFDAMWRLPDRFWLRFRERIDAAKQLTPENRRAIQRARLIEVITLMLTEVA